MRAPPLSLTSDCDIPPLTGKAWPKSGYEVSARQPEELLVAVKAPTVLSCEHASIAAVSTAPGMKQAMARGSSWLRSAQPIR